jgi:hypothetical protein
MTRVAVSSPFLRPCWIAILLAFLTGGVGALDLQLELGMEGESVRETYSVPDTLADTVRVEPNVPIEEQLASVRFREQDTYGSGLLRVRLRGSGSRWRTHLQSLFTANAGRMEVTANGEVELRSRAGRWTWEEALYAQWGASTRQDGYQNTLGFKWTSPRWGGGWQLRARGIWESSQSWGDSLTEIFDYERLRGGLRVAKRWSWNHEAYAEVTLGRKWVAGEGSGSYRNAQWEMGWDGTLGGTWSASVDYLGERRDYLERLSVADSYWDHALEVRVRRTGRLEWEGRWGWRQTDYDSTGTIFFDQREWSGLLLASRAVGRSWRVGLGPGGEWLQELGDAASGSYVAGYAQLELSREPLEGSWLHVTFRVGRRDYAEEAPSQFIIFEGYSLSLARSDFTFYSLSVLGEILLPWRLTLEAYLQVDRERHERPEDDFDLDILTVRLVRALD